MGWGEHPPHLRFPNLSSQPICVAPGVHVPVSADGVYSQSIIQHRLNLGPHVPRATRGLMGMVGTPQALTPGNTQSARVSMCLWGEVTSVPSSLRPGLCMTMLTLSCVQTGVGNGLMPSRGRAATSHL